MKVIIPLALLLILSSCWPSSVSLNDTGSMPPEWKQFYLTTLKNNNANTPISYAPELSEAIKDGIQNNTRLQLSSTEKEAQIEIEGEILNYTISPVAIQAGDQAAQNRLTVSASFSIYIKEPEEDEMKLTSTRFVDYDSSTDLGTVETNLLEQVTDQIVQDVINKLLSNW